MTTTPEPQTEPHVIERGTGYSVAWTNTLDTHPDPAFSTPTEQADHIGRPHAWDAF